MRNFILGLICGIVIATVGFTGIARLLDNGVQVVKQAAEAGAKPVEAPSK